ncbi:uncharacterized protein LOC107812539 [Nicotiana tabacum]|uniref:Uncharacterized protein LOC107812539 n=3 Tax=Nicotiana TaxID=4085 RepID=A0A1S4BWF2_TOBAC|nr:PREDICTED: uncharacterized protein LOC104248600 [Nicotiana sylvestris]XP_016493168.1 PREDICTED: uncharacterized protein LOC107812539 [Nicotiana tabacum]
MSRLAVCGPSASLLPIQSPCSSSSTSICHWAPRLRRKAHLRRKATVFCSADEVDFKVLTSVTSSYNNIVILDTPDSRVLLLDSSNNVHSILHKGKKWTDAYWDEFATLPAIVPRGPIAIFGLGGATAAHLMLELWPSLQLVGWEIDEILIEKAREYLGLSDLEKHNEGGGVLEVHIGDVFSPSVTIPGGYAGIIVDLFSDGKVLPQLQEVTTWLEMNKMLMPNGRLMVNCGAATKEWSNTSSEMIQPEISEKDDPRELNATINALCKAFPGQVSWKKLPKRAGENFLALTGPLPDLAIWSARFPDQLSSSVKEWRSCMPS